MPPSGYSNLLALNRSGNTKCHHQARSIYKKLQSFQRERGWRSLTAEYTHQKQNQRSYEIGTLNHSFSVPIRLSGTMAWLSFSNPCQMARLFLNKPCQLFILLKNGVTIRGKTAPTLSCTQRWSIISETCLQVLLQSTWSYEFFCTLHCHYSSVINDAS